MTHLDRLWKMPWSNLKIDWANCQKSLTILATSLYLSLIPSPVKAQNLYKSLYSSNYNNLINPSSLHSQNLPTPNIIQPEEEGIQTDISVIVNEFEILGSSVFSQQELQKITQPFVGRTLSFTELFQVRSAITKLYTDNGYINSGAYIPEQQVESGKLTIQILEGELEAINITGNKRLNSDYVRKRIALAAGKPVNIDSILKALQLLRLDPLIENISAELSTGIRPGTSLLDVEIEEADAFTVSAILDNSRSPSVGTFRRGASITHNNLFGFGDRFDFQYTNTDGSDRFDLDYTVPINLRNGKLGLRYGINFNDIVEEPFTPLDIKSESRYYELNLRQPIIQRPDNELSLGLAFSRVESETSVLDEPFRISVGADDQGRTKISALRFSQEWVNRGENQVIAARSQFSIGIDAFEATINEDAPDSSFFAWRGQGQWIRRLDEDFLFVLRGDTQLSTSSLVPLEQFRLGGFGSVRGYRQDLSLGDNGLFTSAELRIPIWRIPSIDGLVQLTPFVDIGVVWNQEDNIEIEDDILLSLGIGLNFTIGDNFNARLDWGIPLIDVDSEGNSLQENGIYFLLNYDLF
ncbi:MAG: ShlB/FhaC/HecB family hemolysin secretion/activation protein [Xenococcaceae cyanobacterium]